MKIIPDPNPTLGVISAARQSFVKAMSDAHLGGVLATVIKNQKRRELVSFVKQLATYVAHACGGDYTKLLGSGFPPHKITRDPVGHLSTPQRPVLKHGTKSGEIIGSTKPVRGVFVYNWQLALASDPTTILQTKQSTGRKATLTSLTPGQVYIVQVNAVGAAGPTDFSGPSRLMSL